MSAAGEFLFARPPTRDGFPDSSLVIGVAFEVGGAVVESWGFVVDRIVFDPGDAGACNHRRERIAEGRTIEEACANAREALADG